MKSIGKYQVIEELGASATGQRFRVRDTFRNRDFAVKVLKNVPGLSAEARQQFCAYLAPCADLAHRHIAKVHDLGEIEEGIFIATEWHSGMDLWRYLRTHQDLLLLDQKLVLIAQIAEGLAFAHSRDIAHGNLKPSNVFVDNSRDVSILDFGIAKWLQAQLDAGIRPEGLVAKYLAPEQVLDRPFDGRSDIFALGVILYEFVSGRYPFSEDAGLLPREIVHTEPAPLRSIDQNIPVELEQLVARALQKDPEQRLQTAEELASGLYLAAQQVRRLPSAPVSPPQSSDPPVEQPPSSDRVPTHIARPMILEERIPEQRAPEPVAAPSAFNMPAEPLVAPGVQSEQPPVRKRPQDAEGEPRPWTARSQAYRNSTKPLSEQRPSTPAAVADPGQAPGPAAASRPALPPPINLEYEPPQSFLTPETLIPPVPGEPRQPRSVSMMKGVVAAGLGLILAAIIVSSFISRQSLRAAPSRKHASATVAEPFAPAPDVAAPKPKPAARSEASVQKPAEPAVVSAAEPPQIARISAKQTLNGPVRVLWEAGRYAQALALVDQILVTDPSSEEARAWRKKIRNAQAAEAALK